MLSTLAPLTIGDVTLTPQIVNGALQSLGGIEVASTTLRNPATRFVPWFDTYEGDLFRQFRFLGVEQRGEATVLRTQAMSDPDVLFRERRDSSGDLIFRKASWDAAPLAVDLAIVLAPAEATFDGRRLTGFRYWFEYDGGEVAIHRFLDRQTWEVGGTLDDVTVNVRNWSHAPSIRVGQASHFTTGALPTETEVAFPGNLWGRWSLLPAFDFQYGAAGVLVAWFDRVSLIRTLIETTPGEDWLRVLDMHFFAQSTTVSTNPKTVLFSPDPLDDVDALNLWTRVYDQERDKARAQYGIQLEPPPPICMDENLWTGYRLDSSYNQVMDVAEEFGAEYLFIDAVWENEQAYKETLKTLVPPERTAGTILDKFTLEHMCLTLDFEVADVFGGEVGLKALCDRARAKGLQVISWMASHYSPRTHLATNRQLGHGTGGIWATKESGHHPDTGYAGHCWPANFNAPIVEKLRDQVIGVCQRTGLNGYLWDSFSNLGWWQIDYSDGSMAPQFEKTMQLYAEMINAGYYIRPEALVAFSNNSCVGMGGGNHYPPGLLAGYGYNTAIGLPMEYQVQMLKGDASIDQLFQWIAHQHIPPFHFQQIPREEWDAARVEELKTLFHVYKHYRHLMQRRTVLPDLVGVRWENGSPSQLFFSFVPQTCPISGRVTDTASGALVPDGNLEANRVYLITASLR